MRRKSLHIFAVIKIRLYNRWCLGDEVLYVQEQIQAGANKVVLIIEIFASTHRPVKQTVANH